MRTLLSLTLLFAACDDEPARPGGGPVGVAEGEGEGEGEAGDPGDGPDGTPDGEGEGEAGDPDDPGGDAGGEQGDPPAPGEGEGEGEADPDPDPAGEGEGEGDVDPPDPAGEGEGEGEVDPPDPPDPAGEGEGEVDPPDPPDPVGEGEGEVDPPDPPDPVEDDEYEENDTQDAAAELQPGNYDLVMAEDDEDWFSVDVCAGGRLTVVTDSVDFGGELEVAVHDEQGRELEEDAGAGNLGVIRLRTEEAATLYIRTWGFSGRANDSYTLRIDVDCGLPADDGFEENDSFDDAVPINFGEHAGLIVHPDDEDWYTFAACDNGRVEIRIEFEDVLSDVDLQLKDENNRNIRQVFTRNDHEEITYRFVEDMTAYIRVHNDGDWENDYSLSVQLACP